MFDCIYYRKSKDTSGGHENPMDLLTYDALQNKRQLFSRAFDRLTTKTIQQEQDSNRKSYCIHTSEEAMERFGTKRMK